MIYEQIITSFFFKEDIHIRARNKYSLDQEALAESFLCIIHTHTGVRTTCSGEVDAEPIYNRGLVRQLLTKSKKRKILKPFKFKNCLRFACWKTYSFRQCTYLKLSNNIFFTI